MPFDAQGNYSLPQVYLAETGTTIEAAQHNTPLQDLQSALSSLVLRSGVAPFTGQLKGFAGTVSAPGISFNAATSSGMFNDGGNLGLASAGAKVGFVYIGAGMDYWGTTAPAGWLFPYGQAISRTTYAALFAVLGTTYGVGDGSTTFNMPDKRDRASFGKGDMGGTGAGRITGVPAGGWVGTTLGAAGGSQSHQLVAAELPTITPTTASITQPAFGYERTSIGSTTPAGTGGSTAAALLASTSTAASQTQNVAVTMNSFGSNGAHNNLPPGIVCNYIIFAGA